MWRGRRERTLFAGEPLSRLGFIVARCSSTVANVQSQVVEASVLQRLEQQRRELVFIDYLTIEFILHPH